MTGLDVCTSGYTGKERDGTPMTESGNDYFQARYYNSSVGRFLSPDWSAKVEPIPYSKLDNPQSLNLYAYVENNPLGGLDPDGHEQSQDAPDQANGNQQFYATNWPQLAQAMEESESVFSGSISWSQVDKSDADRKAAQQQYGRQPDGSYKADPAKVKAAIAAGKPIGSGECVAACHALTGVTEHTDSWTPGKSVLDLNDTTDVGLGIASFGPNGKFKQPGGDQNSATYMGHDPKTGQIMVVDQWPPPNAKQYNAPNLHPLANFGPNSNGPSGRIENNAYHYHVIIVP